jgi:ferritin-like metal-binding protein YciE
MTLRTMKDLLVRELNELRGGEKDWVEVLPRLENAAAHRALAEAFTRHHEIARDHMMMLDTVFKTIGASPRPFSSAESQGMKGLCRDCLRLAEMQEAEFHVRDAALIASAQHTAHDRIAGYGCARTWARLLGYDQAATKLEAALRAERDFDDHLTALASDLNKEALSVGAV